MPSNIWDVLGKAGEGAVKAAVANQNAQNTLKSELMLYKIKSQFEKQLKTGERKEDFAYDLLKEREKIKAGYEEFENWQGRNPGGAPGEVPRVEMGPDAKMKVLKLKDMAERIYMKSPDTWTPQEKQIVEQYKAFTMATRAPQGGGQFDPFANLSQPGMQQPQAQPNAEIILSDKDGNKFRLKNPSQLEEALKQGYSRIK